MLKVQNKKGVTTAQCWHCEQYADPSVIFVCDGCGRGSHLACVPSERPGEDEDFFCSSTCGGDSKKTVTKRRRTAEVKKSDEDFAVMEEFIPWLSVDHQPAQKLPLKDAAKESTFHFNGQTYTTKKNEKVQFRCTFGADYVAVTREANSEPLSINGVLAEVNAHVQLSPTMTHTLCWNKQHFFVLKFDREVPWRT